MPREYVAVFGSYRPQPGEPTYELAFDVGRFLAEAGFDLINGGHDGTMRASAEGARQAGANVIGVTCASVRSVRGIETNPFLTQVIEAPDLLTRIEIMMRRASAYVILEGGTGTLAELAIVWEYVGKAMISPRPIVCIGGAWNATIDDIAARYEHSARFIHRCDTAQEAVACIKDHARPVPTADRDFVAHGFR